jgi:eukaryotic-like serine/threonine-protein kinase
MASDLKPGSNVSHYRVTGLLGSGGMGQVFRASDPRLGRDVAIKILPSNTDAGLRDRFSQEARAASALNHPNIVAVYDIGSHEETAYIVSELVEGESLRTIVERGPIPVRRLLDIAAQIADGVAAAHTAGIVHRDLKPENIMITRDGRVKILDFGLAKIQQSAHGEETETAVMNATTPGMILGTVNYMSPEQARGAPVDYRSDQFSLGIVFYEMASGKQPFHRDSTAQTMSAIIADDPDPIPPEIKVPVPLRWIMDRCLAKEPEARYASTSDLYRDLRQLRDRISEASVFGVVAAEALPPSKRRWIPKMAAMILLPLAGLATGYGFARWFGPPAVDLAAYRFTPLATETGLDVAPKWSPDGKSVAYLHDVDGHGQVFVRSLNNPTPAQVTHSKHDVVRLFWSPVQPRILYQSDDALWSISLVGGEPERIIDRVRAAAISPDGQTLALMRTNGRGFNNGGLEISSPPGAEAKPYPGSPFKPGYYYGGTQLQFSPDGSKIFFGFAHPGGAPESWLLPYPNQDGKAKPIRVFASLRTTVRSFHWLPDGRHAIIGLSHAFYDGHLWLADLARETLRQITAGTGTETDGAVSPDGERIAYTTRDTDFDLVSIPLDGSPIHKTVATSRREHSVAWSPAAPQFAYVSDREGAYEIWLKSDRDGWERPIVKPSDFPDGDTNALIAELAFSPDGNRIAYTRWSQDKYAIWISPITGGPAVRLREELEGEFSPMWSPDGNSILYLLIQGVQIGAAKVRIGKTDSLEKLTKGAWGKMRNPNLAWSPRGDWVAIDTEDGLTLASPDSDASRLVNSRRYGELEWSRDSKTIYGIRREGRETLVCSLDAGTGKEIVISRLGPEWNLSDPIDVGLNLALSYDGTSLWTTARRDHSEVWLLDGWKGK